MAVLTNIGRGIKRSFNGTTGFFRSSYQEFKKVKWPTRKEMVKYTTVVIAAVVVLTIFFFLVDMGIAQLVQLITKK
jgi:preprotein translocase subunit SecE